MSAAIAHHPGAEHGEGPSWDPAAGRLIWVDLERGIVHSWDPATGEDDPVEVGQPVGAAVSRAGGGLALALRDGFALLDPGSERPRMVADTEADKPGNRMNDGKCDSSGRFWAGTMAFDSEAGAGALYRLDPDGNVTTVLENVTISNGLDWSPDEELMYFIDSPELRVDVFDYDRVTGAVENRRPLLSTPEELGVPDGMTLDAEGFLWVAFYGGGRVRRYAPDGALEREELLPVAYTTSCAFGGEALERLFVTTSRLELDSDDTSAAGAVFELDPGTRGRAAHAFAG